MKLFITDHADESVGLSAGTYSIETPINQDDYIEDRDSFRALMVDVYSQFAVGSVSAFYEDEDPDDELTFFDKIPLDLTDLD